MMDGIQLRGLRLLMVLLTSFNNVRFHIEQLKILKKPFSAKYALNPGGVDRHIYVLLSDDGYCLVNIKCTSRICLDFCKWMLLNEPIRCFYTDIKINNFSGTDRFNPWKT